MHKTNYWRGFAKMSFVVICIALVAIYAVNINLI